MAHTNKSTPRSKTAAAEKPPKTTPTVRKSRKKVDAEVSPERRREMIAEAAYLRAEQRGFGPGDPLDDWLAAEREVDLLLGGNATPIAQ